MSTTSTPASIDLSDNTNLFASAPSAARVLAAWGEDTRASAARYPAAYAPDLRRAAASYLGVGDAEVTTGAGSDAVLDGILRALARPGDTLAISDPTFTMLPFFGRASHLVVRAVPLANDGDVDAAALLEGDPRVVYVCSPNNPTGASVRRDTLARIVAEARGIVIVDQAYAEYEDGEGGEDDALAIAGRAPRTGKVLVTRTLSKAFGLAGMRVGYAVGPKRLVDAVEHVRAPYQVGALAEQMAAAALTHDVAWVRSHAAEVRALRAVFVERLARLGLSPLPSCANFVLVPVRDATAVRARLAERGVVVRALPKLAGIGDAIRMTVGPSSSIDAAIAALAEVASSPGLVAAPSPAGPGGAVRCA